MRYAMKTFLINTLVNFLGSPQGPARLHGYAQREGMDITFLNLNHDIYSYFFSEKVLTGLLMEARSRLFWALSRDQFFRRNFGSILIKSSAGEMTRLLAEVLLKLETGDLKLETENSIGNTSQPPNFRFRISNFKHYASHFTRYASRPLVRRKLSADNIPFVLLGNIEEVARRIGEAQETMDRHFCRQSADEFLGQFRTLLCGKAIIDALHYPAQLDIGLGFQGTEWSPTAEDTLRAADDRRHNYLIPYYESEVMPKLRREEPGLVGLSATHMSELIPAFTLAKLIRKELPDTHITLGGAAISDIRVRLAKNRCLWNYIDSVVYGPGEIPFLNLAEAVENGREYSNVPNLIYRSNGNVRFSERTAELESDEYATPEYVNLRPGSGVVLETSSSCYWGKCRFCYYPRQGNSRREFTAMPCRERSLERVFEDMRTLVDCHDPCYIGFTDSAIPPKRLEAIVEHNRTSEHSVPFSAFIRFEEKFASRSFCRKLAEGGFLGGQAGLETGTERVNGLINKGINLQLVPKILRNFRHNGILVHAYTLVGFPGETESEAWETYRFIKKHRRDLTMDWQVYPLRVLENGPLAESAEEFGLKVQSLPGNVLVPLCRYESESGLSQSEANRLSVLFETKLAGFRKKVCRWMDAELYKLFLFKSCAEGVWSKQQSVVPRVLSLKSHPKALLHKKIYGREVLSQ